MKTNDKQSNQLNLERKATIDNMEEIIDVKIKPVLDILKDLPRKGNLCLGRDWKTRKS